MIVKVKNNRTVEGLNNTATYAVMAIDKQNCNYYVFNPKYTSIPYAYKSDNFSIIDNHIPETWIEKKGICSFPDWSNESNYYQYLIEDGWMPDKTKIMMVKLFDAYNDLLSAYAKYKYSSVRNAKEHVVDTEHKLKMKMHIERGHQKPDDQSPTDSDAVLLTLENLEV